MFSYAHVFYWKRPTEPKNGFYGNKIEENLFLKNIIITEGMTSMANEVKIFSGFPNGNLVIHFDGILIQITKQ